MAGHQVWMVSASRVASPGVNCGVVEVGKPPADLRQHVFGEQHAKPFFYSPGGANLIGRIMIIEHPGEPGPLPRREVFGGGEQQPPVHPDGVGFGPVPTFEVFDDEKGGHISTGVDSRPRGSPPDVAPTPPSRIGYPPRQDGRPVRVGSHRA